MTQQRSLQRQLALGLGGIVAAISLVSAVISGANMRHEMNEGFDQALQETAQWILPLAVLGLIDRDPQDPAQLVNVLHPDASSFAYVIRDSSGQVLLASKAENLTFPPFETVGFQNTASHRIYYDTALSGDMSIALAEPLTHRKEAAAETFWALVAPLLLLLPLSLLSVWWLVGRAMRPLRGFREDIAARGANDLAPVVTDGLPRELGPIAEAVNQLLARLNRSLEAERSFTANSAHELRTPVAAALAQCQRMLAEVPDQIVQDRGQQIEAALQRLARLSEKLMQLARADGGAVLSQNPQDLTAVLQILMRDFQSTPEGWRLELHQTQGVALSSHLDPDAFGILARNLIENALKHGAQDAPVEVGIPENGILRIRNGGPVIAATTRAQLTNRFSRGETPAQGTGLGLAIAQTIATGAGASLRLASPIPGRVDGIEVVLDLNRATKPHI